MGPRRRPGRRLSSCALRLTVRLAFGLALAGEKKGEGGLSCVWSR